MNFRYHLKQEDLSAIKDILESTGMFFDYEIAVAIELAEINLEKGEADSGYSFIMAENDNEVVGFSCHGFTPCTKASFDLYWIAVKKSAMNRGFGKKILKHAEEMMKNNGCKNLWVETSSREDYHPTRAFYFSMGYSVEAELKDFYGPGDDKVIFVKRC